MWLFLLPCLGSISVLVCNIWKKPCSCNWACLGVCIFFETASTGLGKSDYSAFSIGSALARLSQTILWFPELQLLRSTLPGRNPGLHLGFSFLWEPTHTRPDSCSEQRRMWGCSAVLITAATLLRNYIMRTAFAAALFGFPGELAARVCLGVHAGRRGRGELRGRGG